MDRHSNPFIEPERGGGMIGWAVKQLAIWLFAGLMVYAVVANRQLFRGSEPEAAGPRPTMAQSSGASAVPAPEQKLRPLGQAVLVTNSLTLHAQRDGYAWVDAVVDGTSIKMAFDTGASFVSLTEADATRAGINISGLNYTVPIWTANGANPGAPVTLREVRIGQLIIGDVRAIVQHNLTHSLLGQTFLNRLHGYKMEGGVLTLTWQ